MPIYCLCMQAIAIRDTVLFSSSDKTRKYPTPREITFYIFLKQIINCLAVKQCLQRLAQAKQYLVHEGKPDPTIWPC